jgi:hypothetical protein
VDDLLTQPETEAPKKISSHAIKLGIRNSFASGYQTFFEVGNDTGARVRRHADAVSIGIWPSTGHRIHGFEVKVSRADFKNEMKDGDKAEAIFQFCHHWSLATPPGLVKVDELPPNWGLVTFDGKTLRTVKAAPRLEPVPMTPGFVAAIVRRAGELDTDLIAEAVNKNRLEMEARFTERLDNRLKEHRSNTMREAETALKIVAEMKAALGESYSFEYSVPEIIAAVKVVRQSGVVETYGGLAAIADGLDKASSRIRDSLAAIGAEPITKKTAA